MNELRTISSMYEYTQEVQGCYRKMKTRTMLFHSIIIGGVLETLGLFRNPGTV